MQHAALTLPMFCSDQPTGRLALVFELMDMNIYELIRGRSHYVAEDRIRRYMYQLIKAMDHMHKAGIFHRSALFSLLSLLLLVPPTDVHLCPHVFVCLYHPENRQLKALCSALKQCGSVAKQPEGSQRCTYRKT